LRTEAQGGLEHPVFYALQDEEMHATLDVNIPNYASAIVTRDEIVESLSCL
jgi:hypothetical protein